MGFQVSTLTALPLDPDGSHDSPTWGESGGPYDVPAKEDTGYNGDPLTSNDMNYTRQHWARWTRAMRDRMVFADEGLFATCVVKQGGWNLNAGTLDITLAPTRVVIDVDGDGGTVLEIKAPAGDPETLPASSDVYIDIDESGDVVLVAVANGAPEPAVTSDHARVWRLVTNETELKSAGLVDGVAEFPCFATVGVLQLVVTETFTAQGDINLGNGVSDNVIVGGPLAVNQPATFTDRVDFQAPVTNYTHAISSDWRDDHRPTFRTFAASGQTPEQFGIDVDVQITTSGSSTIRFTRGSGAGLWAFDVMGVLIIGDQPDSVPTDGNIVCRYTFTMRVLGTLSGGDFTAVSYSVVDTISTGLAVTVTPSAVLNVNEIVLRLNIGESNADNAPYRLIYDVKATRLTIA